jgi:hypothetical protein
MEPVDDLRRGGGKEVNADPGLLLEGVEQGLDKTLRATRIYDKVLSLWGREGCLGGSYDQ